MTKEAKKELITGVSGAVLLISSLFVTQSNIKDLMLKISIGYLCAIAVGLIVFIWEEWRQLRLFFQAQGVNRFKPVRVSMAYLFRIEVRGKLLLVRNHRDQPGYQPVGGVYKYLKAENEEQFSAMGIVPCHAMPVDDQSENDLRKQIRERKDLIKFLKWFDSGKNRENDPWREFHEELIVDGVLSSADFPYIQYNLCSRKRTLIHRSPKFPTDELLHADIYELKYSNEAQKLALEKLLGQEDERYIFATPAEIERGYTASGKVILGHTKKLLPKK